MSIDQEKNLLQINHSYESKEYQAIKTFVFQDLQTQRSQIIDFKTNMHQQKIDLSQLFQKYCPLKQNTISIYDPQTNQFVQLSQINAEVSGNIPRLLLQTNIILIRYKTKRLETQCGESDSVAESKFEQNKDKKDRSKERTIGESIQLVKQWRAIHFTSNKSGIKKLSLLQAAKAVGVSKKSLDDYYYQLRLGEYYNFDFANHLEQKIGILRRYVKQFKPSRELANKNMRHPRNLKIIESFQEELPIIKEYPSILSPIIQELRSPSFKNLTIREQSISERQIVVLQDVITFQDNFFKNFQFLLDDPNDPFIGINSNFQKIQSSQDFLSF